MIQGSIGFSIRYGSILLVSGLYGFKFPGASSGFEDGGRARTPASIVTKRTGTMILYVENNINFEEVDVSVLSPPQGSRSENTDEYRFFDWYLERERKERNAIVEGVKRSELFHARNHYGANKVVDHIISMANQSEKRL